MYITYHENIGLSSAWTALTNEGSTFLLPRCVSCNIHEHCTLVNERKFTFFRFFFFLVFLVRWTYIYIVCIVFEMKVFVAALFCVLGKYVIVTMSCYSGGCYTTHASNCGSIICYQYVVCFSLYWLILCCDHFCMEGLDN